MQPVERGSADGSRVRAIDDDVLNRVKDVAQRIVERVRRVTEDNATVVNGGSETPTDEIRMPR